jgi:hypothetical protein
VYSVREPTPQKISTARPSQPERPPGSMHEVLPLGVMHLPWLRQPTVKPQRCWEGHSASVLQLTPGRESCVLEVPLIIVYAWLLPQVVLRLGGMGWRGGREEGGTAAASTAFVAWVRRKCSFCAEEILADARKGKHCGEFVTATFSRIGAIFASGVVIACILAGTQPAPSEGVTAVGVCAIVAAIVCQNDRQRLIEDFPAYRFASSNAN